MRRWLFMPVPPAVVLVPAMIVLALGLVAVGLFSIKAHEGCWSWESSCSVVEP